MNKNKKKKIIDLDLFHNSSFDLFIKESNLINAGYGVFTHDFIPKGSFIDYYVGDIYESSFGGGGTYYFHINDQYGIDAFNQPRCYMAMINDANFNLTVKNRNKNKKQRKNKNKNNIPIINSYSNNCEFRVNEDELEVMVYSKENIEIETELFISYGSDYWQ